MLYDIPFSEYSFFFNGSTHLLKNSFRIASVIENKKRRYSIMHHKKPNNFKRILIICAAAVCVLVIFLYQKIHFVTYEADNATAVAGTISNPYCGWYSIRGYRISDDTKLQLPSDTSAEDKKSAGLVLLQINLNNYADRDISQSGLQQIDDLLSAWSNNGYQLILRFLYDWNGNGLSSEPSDIAQIQRHMEQISGIVNVHKTSVYLLQGIFVGDCGEMHGTKHMGNGGSTLLIEKLASVTDPSIFLSVRTPSQLRDILNSADPLDEDHAFDGTLASRLGLFNDGMLGSGNDLGTYGESHAPELGMNIHWTRTEELDFQDQMCQYVPNGGEVVLDNPFNDADAAISDLSAMHISYLDKDYDANVLNKWKTSAYTGSDPLYQGKSAYDYISDHLGYRYVLKKSFITHSSAFDPTTTLSLQMENTGFSGSYHKFQVKVTLISENGSRLTLPVSTDTRLWKAGETQDLSLELNLSELSTGNYQIYLKLQDPSLNREILLGNSATHTDYGYYSGTVSIRKHT